MTASTAVPRVRGTASRRSASADIKSGRPWIIEQGVPHRPRCSIRSGQKEPRVSGAESREETSQKRDSWSVADSRTRNGCRNVTVDGNMLMQAEIARLKREVNKQKADRDIP
jgi:hypothetical protein